ncbi:NAD(P)H-hydrate dehydratase [Paenalcaligenes niemegkensis]|uniref:NAD(P)H-hydrate dehydratase n=1 Tax=Paenalcaligenes niemegkensis TaxID=2895469 RepID=UPI001EE85D2C|nr:NAD(P)H-hydrate dehydratase [Paenalcaligenes niemegkensis]MCQ9617713.1 NAD(P)H-hydrate dehydratase [Paenalcaligenes niemegkensis]
MPTSHVLTKTALPKLAPRQRDCHKGLLGHVLVVAGGAGMGGAGLLAAQGSLRLGAGLVSLATMAEHVSPSLARQPEIMTQAVHNAQDLQPLLQRASVILIGPGLGQGAWAQDLLNAVAQTETVQIWDADALNLLAQDTNRWGGKRRWILTPHPGEAARLLNCSTQQVQAAREQTALTLAQRFQAVVVLKGAHSLIANSQQLRLCRNGHPAMAGAGFGDVLGGVIAAFVAQDMSLFDASCLGVYVHARAGERCAVDGRGVAASDLFAPMRQLLQQLSPITPAASIP